MEVELEKYEKSIWKELIEDFEHELKAQNKS